jgi:hypothetical protein
LRNTHKRRLNGRKGCRKDYWEHRNKIAGWRKSSL